MNSESDDKIIWHDIIVNNFFISIERCFARLDMYQRT
jgi:hypothetical protein